MRSWLLLIAALPACVGEGARTLSHDFPELVVAAGEERNYICQSWTLHNDQPIHVNALKLTGGQGWHHSNWLYAGERDFAGPDGTWPCEERGFELVQAGLTGGVLYTQSPEVQAESMSFGDGVALVIPAHAKIIAEVHLLNASAHAQTTHARLDLDLLAPEATRTRLAPLALSYFPLALPPGARSQFTTDCDLAAAQNGPIDFRVYYLAPHYHAMGRGMAVEAYRKDGSSRMIHETNRLIGESLAFSPTEPIDLSGAQGIRFTCTYENNGFSEVGFGSGQADEMCVMFAFTDSPRRFVGGVLAGAENFAMSAPDPDMHKFGNKCTVVGTPMK